MIPQIMAEIAPDCRAAKTMITFLKSIIVFSPIFNPNSINAIPNIPDTTPITIFILIEAEGLISWFFNSWQVRLITLKRIAIFIKSSRKIIISPK
jgi:hypothetical protein